MFVSVLIPAFNEARIIERTLTTVRDHLATRPPPHAWELLVVDDGSTDGTGALADAFAAGDERVRVLHLRSNFALGQALRYGRAGPRRRRRHARRRPDLQRRPTSTCCSTPSKRAAQRRRRLAVRARRRDDRRAVSLRLRPAASPTCCWRPPPTRTSPPSPAWCAPTTRASCVRSTCARWGWKVNSEIIRQAQILRARIVEIPAHLDWSGASRQTGPSKLRMQRDDGRARHLGVLVPPGDVLHGARRRAGAARRCSVGLRRRRADGHCCSPPRDRGRWARCNSPDSHSSRFQSQAQLLKICSFSVPRRTARSRREPSREHGC